MKKIIEFFKNPPVWYLVLHYFLTVLSAVGAILLAVFVDMETPLAVFAYVLFAVAALLLAYTVFTIVKFAPRIKQSGKAFTQKFSFTNNLVENYGFRTLVFAVVSLLIGIGFSVFNFVVAGLEASGWYFSLGAYYLLVVFARGGILVQKRNKTRAGDLENTVRDWRSYRASGIMITLLHLALSIAILLMVRNNRAFRYADLMVFVVATYSAYKIAMAIVNIIKARKQSDVAVSALRHVGLAEAAVSLLVLQSALLSAFAEGEYAHYNAITGGVICAFTIALGIYMIVTATRKIKAIKADESATTEAQDE